MSGPLPLFFQSVIASGTLAASPPAGEIPIETFELDNGLTVVLSEDHSAPVVTSYITYRVGSAAEKEGFTGFAHLFEHMMFNGSENVPEGAFAYYVDGTGGSLNGNTEPDRTNYYIAAPNNYLEGLVYLESNRMRSLQITEQALANEKDVVKEEVRQQQENQPFLKTILLEWPATAFESWAYSHSIYGSMEDLSNAPVQAFKDFFAKYYTPNNATLVLVGDFDPKRAKSLVEQYYGPIPKGPDLKLTFPEEPEQKEAVVKNVKDPLAPVPMVLVSWDIPEARTEDRDALELLTAILSSGASSRLNKALVDEKKVALQAFMTAGFPIPTYGPGQLATIMIPSDKASPDELQAAFWEEIERVHEKGVSNKELKKALAKKKFEYLNSLDSTLFKASQLATYEVFYGGAEKFNGDYKRFDKVKVKDLERVAKQYLTKPRSVTFVIEPGGDDAGGMPGPL